MKQANGEEQEEEELPVMRAELIRHILQLPNEAHAKLLAFLHLSEDLRRVDGTLHMDPEGEVRIVLFTGKDADAR